MSFPFGIFVFALLTDEISRTQGTAPPLAFLNTTQMVQSLGVIGEREGKN
jgi:hypothetical protein